MTDLRIAHQAVELETQFADNLHNGRQSDNSNLKLVLGSTPIIISAPHAVNHPRDGQLKLADTFTGPVALQLAEMLRSTALVYAQTYSEDPNYDADGPYKQILAKVAREHGIRFILDVHGMARNRPMELAIGTGMGNTLRREAREAFVTAVRASGFNEMYVDHPQYYNASNPNTIASYSHRELAIPAVQIEIRKDFRDPETLPQNYQTLLHALYNAVKAVSAVLERGQEVAPTHDDASPPT